MPAAELRWLLLEEQTRKVAKSGIRFHSIDFVASELNGLVGETVDVRHRPHDDTSTARQADREAARDDTDRLRRAARDDLLGLPSRRQQ